MIGRILAAVVVVLLLAGCTQPTPCYSDTYDPTCKDIQKHHLGEKVKAIAEGNSTDAKHHNRVATAYEDAFWNGVDCSQHNVTGGPA